MKNSLFVTIAVALMVIASVPVMAQEVKMVFETADQCKAYVVEHNGDVLGYRGTPRDYKGKKEDQKVTFAIPKVKDGCYPMNPLPGLPNGGYVVKRAGDPAVYDNQNSVADRDPDCGNALGKPILFTEFLIPTAPPAPATVVKPPAPMQQPQPAQVTINSCTDVDTLALVRQLQQPSHKKNFSVTVSCGQNNATQMVYDEKPQKPAGSSWEDRLLDAVLPVYAVMPTMYVGDQVMVGGMPYIWYGGGYQYNRNWNSGNYHSHQQPPTSGGGTLPPTGGSGGGTLPPTGGSGGGTSGPTGGNTTYGRSGGSRGGGHR